MFYKTTLRDYIRVTPDLFGMDIKSGVIAQIKKQYEGQISKDMGIIIDVCDVSEVKDGVIVPGDGAPYYEVCFEIINFKPELQEVVLGKVKDIADFGAFLAIGPVEGMVHVSQTMDDFVSFSKDKVLVGKESKRSLRVNDNCRARIIAISFKDITNPKLGLTMRQEGLGKLEWSQEKIEKKEKATKKDGKEKGM